MGIFKSKSNKEETKPKAEAKVKNVAVATPVKAKKTGESVQQSYRMVILRPRITEKASFLSSKDVYVFEIAEDASKDAVAKAVKEMYKVVPVKVSIVRNPSKKVFARGKLGRSGGVKKAYVYLKAGDKIEII